MSDSSSSKKRKHPPLTPENEEQLKQRNAKKDELYRSNFESYLILGGLVLSDVADALGIPHPKPRECKTPKWTPADLISTRIEVGITLNKIPTANQGKNHRLNPESLLAPD